MHGCYQTGEVIVKKNELIDALKAEDICKSVEIAKKEANEARQAVKDSVKIKVPRLLRSSQSAKRRLLQRLLRQKLPARSFPDSRSKTLASSRSDQYLTAAPEEASAQSATVSTSLQAVLLQLVKLSVSSQLSQSVSLVHSLQ